MLDNTKEIKLTEYAHGAGCGCKIAPQVLTEILAGSLVKQQDRKLLVGNESNDDAAVYDLGNGSALISTTDFFMPIVDEAFDFGRVAAANAISDVYAMGGQPILALAILGWPVEKLPTSLAAIVIEGARTVCAEAGIVLAGGHSIDTTEPMFGLSVNGIVSIEHLKRNCTATAGDFIFITKPIGTGILSTARKRKVLKKEDEAELLSVLTSLNSLGAHLSKIKGVTAMTDITGFGLIGHLMEICKGSNLSAEINYHSIPRFDCLPNYIAQSVLPDATFRNWNAYHKEIHLESSVNAAEAFMILPDPQTNGGLLFTVNANGLDEVLALMKKSGLEAHAQPIGRMLSKGEKRIQVLS